MFNLVIDDVEIKFQKAAKDVRELTTKPTDAELLKLYALYKQALFGNNKTSQPSFFQLKEKAKWNEWNKLQGMGRNNAKKSYIEFVEELKMKY